MKTKNVTGAFFPDFKTNKNKTARKEHDDFNVQRQESDFKCGDFY